jgi:ribosomal protein L29
MATSNALVYYHELVKAGIPDEQAFNQAMAFDNAISHLATKEYLQHLETRTDSKFDLVRKDIANLETRIDSKFDLVKKDIANLETRTDSKFDLARQDLKTEIGLLRSEMSINHRWIMAFLIAGLGGIIGMLCK